MSRNLAKSFFVFMLVFTLDVRVKARVVDIPKHCASGESVCAVLNGSGLFKREFSWGALRVGEGSSFEIVSKSEIKLLRGHFTVAAKETTKEPVKVTTLYGDFNLKNGQSFFEVKDQIVSFTNLTANLKYQPRGETQSYDLPPGFMNYLTLINSNGIAEAGYPRLAELKPLVKGWGSLFSSKEVPEFKENFKEFAEHWAKAQKVVGPWYSATVEREIASEKVEEDRQAHVKAMQKAESEKWRKMFRERNFMGVDPGDTRDE